MAGAKGPVIPSILSVTSEHSTNTHEEPGFTFSSLNTIPSLPSLPSVSSLLSPFSELLQGVTLNRSQAAASGPIEVSIQQHSIISTGLRSDKDSNANCLNMGSVVDKLALTKPTSANDQRLEEQQQQQQQQTQATSNNELGNDGASPEAYYAPTEVPRLKALKKKRLTGTRIKQLIRAASRAYDDPPPPPDLGMCCGSLCDPCVNDLWREERDVWRERWGDHAREGDGRVKGKELEW